MIDATYKLNNLRMPLYILMVVDDNGESEVIGLWIVASEDKSTISHLMEIFTSSIFTIFLNQVNYYMLNFQMYKVYVHLF